MSGVIWELRRVAVGKCFITRLLQVRMDGSDGKTDLRLNKSDSLGIYHRSTTKPDGSVLLVGEPSHFHTVF